MGKEEAKGFTKKKLKLDGSKTIVNSLEKTVKNIIDTEISKVIDKITKEVESVKENVEKFKSKLEGIDDVIKEVVDDIIPKIPKNLESLQDAARNIEKYIKFMALKILGDYQQIICFVIITNSNHKDALNMNS